MAAEEVVLLGGEASAASLGFQLQRNRHALLRRLSHGPRWPNMRKIDLFYLFCSFWFMTHAMNGSGARNERTVT